MGAIIQNFAEFRERLAAEADDDYREFSMRGIPSERPFVGVRIPQIREIVNQIVPEKYSEFFCVEPVAIEEVLARGMIIGKMPYDAMLNYFDSQINYIDNWCTCDVFCADITKKIKKRRDAFLNLKIEGLLVDSREFAARVGLVLLKCGYVDFDYLAVIFDRVERLGKREEYYVKMAIAWLVAECFVKYPEETMGYLRVSKLPVWTYNKTISKICDSHRVEREMKDVLRRMRK